MNQDERKKFWDVLLTMHDAAPEHIQQLQKRQQKLLRL